MLEIRNRKTLQSKIKVCKSDVKIEVDKQRYNTKTKNIASTIVLPTDALLCKNTNCTEHHNDIDNFYDSIIASLKSSANPCIPSSNVSHKAY